MITDVCLCPTTPDEAVWSSWKGTLAKALVLRQPPDVRTVVQWVATTTRRTLPHLSECSWLLDFAQAFCRGDDAAGILELVGRGTASASSYTGGFYIEHPRMTLYRFCKAAIVAPEQEAQAVVRDAIRLAEANRHWADDPVAEAQLQLDELLDVLGLGELRTVELSAAEREIALGLAADWHQPPATLLPAVRTIAAA